MDSASGTRVTVTPVGGASPAADVRICSPDGTGLGCDLARTIFDFGLVVERGDFSTDGKWSFLMFKVRPGNGLQRVAPWALLKQRLEAVCPVDPSAAKLRSTGATREAQRQLFIFQVEVTDRVGLLHDVTQALWERELTVHRAHVSTSPSNQAVDLFYVTDLHGELPSTERFADVQSYVRSRLGAVPAKFSLFPAPPNPDCCCGSTIPCDGTICGARGTGRMGDEQEGVPERTAAVDMVIEQEDLVDARTSGYAETTVTVDNYTSKAHTVLQVRTQDRKGLLYDSLRATKDLKINVSYGKVEVRESGVCELDLFVGRNSSEEVERNLCKRLKRAIERPLVVGLSSKGADSVTTELCVTAPMDAAGFARPRVLLDVTDALRSLGVMVFKADIHSARSPGRPLLEVHRFLLTDLAGQPIVDPGLRTKLVQRVRASLLD